MSKKKKLSATVYEINNPSDKYTMKSDSEAAAVAACLLLGRGAYTLSPEPGGKDPGMPFFILGGNPNEWFQDKYQAGSIDTFITDQGEKIAEALDSVLIGGFESRREVEAALARMSPEDGKAFLEERHNRRRTSMSDIGTYAKDLARAIREIAKEKKRG